MSWVSKAWDLLPSWPYLVALGPALACLIYRLRKNGVSGFLSHLSHSGLVYSGVITGIILAHVAVSGTLPWHLSLKEKLILLGSAAIVGSVASVQGLRRTPLGDWLRVRMHRAWWGPRHIVESHPMAAAVLDLKAILASLGAGDGPKLLRLREQLSGINSKVLTMVEQLQLPPAGAKRLATAIDECRAAFSADAPDAWDLHSCRTTVHCLCGTIEGIVEAGAWEDSTSGARTIAARSEVGNSKTRRSSRK